ncbi:TetR/AcrR family transcriptional regulator [Nocardioides sp. NPDC101246]|uniref:TetR/AcrR family transcriptional regulator n=1 Tax=Nocardioides sp. NPDC101246 TaxID=3364336 RepID=UPI003809E9E0
MSRDQRILRAAEKLFHERSFDGTGVDAIAREAGITGSGVYRHFGSKAAILLALMEEVADTLLERVGSPLSDHREDLELLLTTHAAVVDEQPRLVDVWRREQHNLAPPDAAEFHARQRLYVDRWVPTLDACHPGHTRSELVTAMHAVHDLLTSDSSRRRDGAGSGAPAQQLLVHMARAALDALSLDPAVPAPRT